MTTEAKAITATKYDFDAFEEQFIEKFKKIVTAAKIACNGEVLHCEYSLKFQGKSNPSFEGVITCPRKD